MKLICLDARHINPNDYIKRFSSLFWYDTDDKPRQRDRQLIHKKARRRSKQDILRELNSEEPQYWHDSEEEYKLRIEQEKYEEEYRSSEDD